MPRGDRTGPMGMGPMTGRQAGYCNGFALPGDAGPVGFAEGLGCGFGCGRARGHRNVYRATGMPAWARYGDPANSGGTRFDEKAFLSNRAEFLKSQLQQIKERLSGLDEEGE